jgi:hypothetical protein
MARSDVGERIAAVVAANGLRRSDSTRQRPTSPWEDRGSNAIAASPQAITSVLSPLGVVKAALA